MSQEHVERKAWYTYLPAIARWLLLIYTGVGSLVFILNILFSNVHSSGISIYVQLSWFLTLLALFLNLRWLTLVYPVGIFLHFYLDLKYPSTLTGVVNDLPFSLLPLVHFVVWILAVLAPAGNRRYLFCGTKGNVEVLEEGMTSGHGSKVKKGQSDV